MVSRKLPNPSAPWLTNVGLDLSLYPIDSVLRLALSQDGEEFRSGCTFLASMCNAGRPEAGIYLLGLTCNFAQDYYRLELIAQALATHRTVATVAVLATELRRVKGSSATRAYLRRIVETLASFPSELVDETIEALSLDPRVGALSSAPAFDFAAVMRARLARTRMTRKGAAAGIQARPVEDGYQSASVLHGELGLHYMPRADFRSS